MREKTRQADPKPIIDQVGRTLTDGRVQGALRAASESLFIQAQTTARGTCINSKGGIDKIVHYDPREIITPESLLKLSNAAVTAQDLLAAGLNTLAEITTFGSGIHMGSEAVNLEDILTNSNQNVTGLLARGKELADRIATQTKLRSLQNLAVPARQGIVVALAGARAMPQLLRNIDTAREIYEKAVPKGEILIGQMHAMLTRLRQAQQLVHNKLPSIETDLGRYADKVKGFSVSSDPEEMEGVVSGLESLNRRVIEIAQESGVQYELPPLIVTAFNALVTQDGSIIPLRRSLATTRNAAAACLVLEMQGFTLTASVVNSAIGMADAAIRASMGEITRRQVADVVESMRANLIGLPSAIESINLKTPQTPAAISEI